MPPVDVTDPERLYRATLHFTSAEAGYKPEFTTGFWFYDDAATARTPAAVHTLADTEIRRWYDLAASTDDIRPSLADGVVFATLETERPLMDPEPVGLSTTLNFAGTGVGDALPADLAIVISWRSDTSGQSYRGRSYLGGIAETLNANGVILEANRAAIEVASNRLITDMAAEDLPMQVVSQIKDSLPRVPPVRTEVISALVDQHWDVQRRRGAR